MKKKILEQLIERADEKLMQAYTARCDVMDYLENQYGINTRENCEVIEDEFTWVYGIDREGVEELIKKRGD